MAQTSENEHLIWAEIDLDAIAHNLRFLRKKARPPASLMAVIKANAYGHGAKEVARTALANGASSLAVARVEEGIELRNAGLAAPILILGPFLPCHIRAILRYRLTPTLFDMGSAVSLSEAASGANRKIPVHLKFDTGMGRLGFYGENQVNPAPLVRQLAQLSGLRIHGIYTHFATADEKDTSYTRMQLESFRHILARLEEKKLRPPIAHSANSAGILFHPESHLDLVRCGIALYGIQPSQELPPTPFLRPALSLKSRILQLKKIPADTSISYGRTWTAPAPSLCATIACGYGDGFPRILSNRADVLVRGVRVPVRGRVCMDLTMLDVSAVPEVRVGDKVTLLGKDGEEEITAQELAGLAQTIPYEIVTGIVGRVPRVFNPFRKAEKP